METDGSSDESETVGFGDGADRAYRDVGDDDLFGTLLIAAMSAFGPAKVPHGLVSVVRRGVAFVNRGCTRYRVRSYTMSDVTINDAGASGGQHGQTPAEYAEEHYFQNDSRTNRERMLAGDFYIGGDDPDSARISQQGYALCDEYYRATVGADPDAGRFLKRLVGSIGEDSYVKPPLFVDYGENIHIGRRTFVNMNLTALDVVDITIGDDCQIGPNVQLLTPVHPIDPVPRRDKLEAAKPIVIGDNVWLGGGVIVCPGVTIGSNSVIGAGSVVTRDIPANVVAVGNPCRVLRPIDDRD